MNDQGVLQLAAQALATAAQLSAPLLLSSLATGLAVSLFQSVTSIQEVTLSFVPKLAGIALVLLVSGHWMIGRLVAFTDSLFKLLPKLLNAT